VESNIEEPIGDEDRALNKEGIKIREKDPTRREVKRTRNQDKRVKKKIQKNTHALSLDDDSSASCHMSAMKSFKAPGGSRKSTTTGSPQKNKQSHQQPAKASPNLWEGVKKKGGKSRKGGRC
jgi:hypothetical protein